MLCMNERKVDQVVAELERYNVDVAGVQEVKWFGCGVYRVAESVVIAAGRPVPSAGVVNRRGEGVAIVLSGQAMKAWSSSGSRWKAWSYRLVLLLWRRRHKRLMRRLESGCYSRPSTWSLAG